MDALLKTATLIMLGATDEENGDYTLFFSRELYLDTNGEHDKIIHLLNDDELQLKPINENNHCGLVLDYKSDRND